MEAFMLTTCVEGGGAKLGVMRRRILERPLALSYLTIHLPLLIHPGDDISFPNALALRSLRLVAS